MIYTSLCRLFGVTTLENLFSDLEAKWPPMVERLKEEQDVADSLEGKFAFMARRISRLIPAAPKNNHSVIPLATTKADSSIPEQCADSET